MPRSLTACSEDPIAETTSPFRGRSSEQCAAWRSRASREFAETPDAVKRHVVGVVCVVRSSGFVVESRPADGNDVVSFKQPVHVLKPVLLAIRMVEENRANLPLLQVG
jgi:hypothetical protein